MRERVLHYLLFGKHLMCLKTDAAGGTILAHEITIGCSSPEDKRLRCHRIKESVDTQNVQS